MQYQLKKVLQLSKLYQLNIEGKKKTMIFLNFLLTCRVSFYTEGLWNNFVNSTI